MAKTSLSNERNNAAHNLLRLIRQAGENKDVRVLVGAVKSVAPPLVFEFNGLEFDIEAGDFVKVATDLLGWEEVVTVLEDGMYREQTILHPSRLFVGTDVLALYDEDNGEFYVIATL